MVSFLLVGGIFMIVLLIRRARSVGRGRRQKVVLPLTAPHQLHLIRDQLPTAHRNLGSSAPNQVVMCVYMWLASTMLAL